MASSSTRVFLRVVVPVKKFSVIFQSSRAEIKNGLLQIGRTVNFASFHLRDTAPFLDDFL